MKRTSTSKASLLGVFVFVSVCVPMPPTLATPTIPLKSVIVEGSKPGAGKKMWNISVPGPRAWMPPGIGLGCWNLSEPPPPLPVRPGLSRWSALDRDYRAAFVFDFQEIQILLLPLFEVFT